MASTEGLDPVSTKRMDGALTELEQAVDSLSSFSVGLADLLGDAMRPENVKDEDVSSVNPMEEAGAYVYRVRHAIATVSAVHRRLQGYTFRLDV